MPIFQPIVFVALGVNRSFEDVPKIVTGLVFPLEKPIDAGGKENKHLAVHIYNFDSTFAPPGKSVLTIMLESSFAHWDALRKDTVRYKAEKAIIASDVISALDKRFPGLARQVEMAGVATA